MQPEQVDCMTFTSDQHDAQLAICSLHILLLIFPAPITFSWPQSPFANQQLII
jgi:hypothetical protein